MAQEQLCFPRAPLLLLGSVPLRDAEEVFGAVADEIGNLVLGIPDGETGVRKNWVGWQQGAFGAAPFLERVEFSGMLFGKPQTMVAYRFRETTETPRFGPLGYAREALASYRSFARLKAAGRVPASVRFQISLPTPFALMTMVDPASCARVEPLYEQRMREEVEELVAAIPNEQLAIQWDTAIEFAVLERVLPLAGDKDAILKRLVRLTSYVPEAVQMGFHFCYGDSGHQHFKEPDDTSLMVEIANELTARAVRPLDWLHLPVPRARSDDPYFRPLQQLALHPRTRLFLGLVHWTDGVDGGKRRIEAARKHVHEFGIATECGLGRRPPETIRPLLSLHKQLAALL